MTGSTPSSVRSSTSRQTPVETLVVCEAAGRTFGKGNVAVVAVHEVSCTITSTSRIALLGPSGSGKSTLLQLMAGLDQPTSGTIAWPAWPGGPFQDPSRAGVIFQGLSLIPGLTAAENVAFPLLLQGVEDREAMSRARGSLALLDIGALGDKLPDELSGGQAQRVATARVVTSGPRLIFADEPTGQLDHVSGERVIDVLLEAAAHLGAGLVVSTHDSTVAARLDEQWRMRDGQLVVTT
ncbi:ABC transporter ATP-binding protein [Nocardioides panaciterrulae]|uniref:Putative ABC-type transport system involved in lysophospholipase L1 biosynthesis ATPase subunit n=1 Tax=Nocardioides panaciterrulae TaxID=661492 RepID=A0A7Y9E7X3_9ACTN|nr:ATP-binding cassette domain-containing protein [Nocardioides panaciterrulae]NYD42632.1 putative ABC-type transport system involved in lysophospholipase L1 biosynthesis ATPase subunit [Nocardioides panaciterrulae]